MKNVKNSVVTYVAKFFCREEEFYNKEDVYKWVDKRIADFEASLKRPCLAKKDEVEIDRRDNKFAYYVGYTDQRAYEIVRVVSDKTIEVRRLDAELDPSWKPEFIVGGFSANCVNQQSQKWSFKSNEENGIVRLRLAKSGYWVNKGSKFKLSVEPIEFYDYNF